MVRHPAVERGCGRCGGLGFKISYRSHESSPLRRERCLGCGSRLQQIARLLIGGAEGGQLHMSRRAPGLSPG